MTPEQIDRGWRIVGALHALAYDIERAMDDDALGAVPVAIAIVVVPVDKEYPPRVLGIDGPHVLNSLLSLGQRACTDRLMTCAAAALPAVVVPVPDAAPQEDASETDDCGNVR